MSVKTTEVPQTETKAFVIGQFGGVLSGFQRVAFRDLVHAGFDRVIAHKISMDYGAQLGLAMRNDDNLKTKISKANSNGVHKLAGSFSDKLVMHNACAIVRIIQVMSGLVEEKLLTSYSALNLNALNEQLTKYVSECEAWTLEQKWEEPKK